jgi:hypothetical protein
VAARAGTDLTNPANWSNEARLTDASFDLEKAGVWAGRGFFLGDYQGFAAAGNSFNGFFSMPNGTDPGDIYFRDPVADASTVVAGDPADWTGSPGAADDLLTSAAALALPSPAPIVFPAAAAMTPATTAPLSLPERTDRMVPSPARLSGTLTAGLVRAAATGSADDRGTDVLTSADPSWDGGLPLGPAANRGPNR